MEIKKEEINRVFAFIGGTGEPEINSLFRTLRGEKDLHDARHPSATGIVYILEPKNEDQPTAIYANGEYAPGLTTQQSVIKAAAEAAAKLDPLAKEGCIIDLVTDPVMAVKLRTLKNSPTGDKEEIAIAVAAVERGWFDHRRTTESLRNLQPTEREAFQRDVERIKRDLERAEKKAEAILNEFPKLAEELTRTKDFLKRINVFVHSTAEARQLFEREGRDPDLAAETLRAAHATARLVAGAGPNAAAKETILLEHEKKIANLWTLAERRQAERLQQNITNQTREMNNPYLIR